MSATQILLFPDPKPLVERLGPEFFRALPQTAGVYLMRDEANTPLYIGKAKNLRKRLSSYRVANPDRLRRRHLRLLRQVAWIEIEHCPDEAAALAREAELLRALKPKFNRAGTWPGKPRYLGWRCGAQAVELTVLDAAEDGWEKVGPMGRQALFLRAALARLLRLAVDPRRGFGGMPAGWVRGSFGERALVCCVGGTEKIQEMLAMLFGGNPEPFCSWVQSLIPPRSHAIELTIVAEDLETLSEFARRNLTPAPVPLN